MPTFKDTDELRIYLKTFKTYDDFWAGKEPDFDDVFIKTVYDKRIKNDPDIDLDAVLLALKQHEVRRFVEEQKARSDTHLH